MRNTFARVLTEEAQKDKDIVLLSGDIGNRMFDKFKNSVSRNRFFNCGIAESNMMSVAAGMALSGLKPIVYTITPFTTTRCLEQIKIGVCYHDAPVIIVGTGSGLSYAELGATHHSLEDIAILNCLPNIQILTPADSLQLEIQFREALASNKPTYLRIGKKGEPNLHDSNINLGIGKANFLKKGEGILILGVGPIIDEALKAAIYLSNQNQNISVLNMGSIRPLDEEILDYCYEQNYHNWITLEEHYTLGGLSSTIEKWLRKKKSNKKINLKSLGTPIEFFNELGDQKFLRKKFGIDAEGILSLIKSI